MRCLECLDAGGFPTCGGGSPVRPRQLLHLRLTLRWWEGHLIRVSGKTQAEGMATSCRVIVFCFAFCTVSSSAGDGQRDGEQRR